MQGDFNRAKTHCPQEHEYTEENTYINPGGRRWCRTCMQANGRIQRLKKYGLTPEQYDIMLAAQKGSCKLCNTKFKGTRDTNIDHDHGCCNKDGSCGQCIRGILCGECNRGLARFNDSVDLLLLAAEYVEKCGAI
jgi:hypothetical protein